ncbi:hypothetical protein MASR2M32_17150 [Sphaerotilus sulfidivorans]
MLDVNYREDACLIRRDHGPHNMATLRRIAQNQIKLAASNCISRSSHIVIAPHAFSAALLAFQFVVRYFVRFFLASLTASVYEQGDCISHRSKFVHG